MNIVQKSGDLSQKVLLTIPFTSASILGCVVDVVSSRHFVSGPVIISPRRFFDYLNGLPEVQWTATGNSTIYSLKLYDPVLNP